MGQAEFFQTINKADLICVPVLKRNLSNENPDVRRVLLTALWSIKVPCDLVDEQVREEVKKDYELVRQTVRASGFQALTGKMGILVQPRTKGLGHGSTTRAFYARTGFLQEILNF